MPKSYRRRHGDDAVLDHAVLAARRRGPCNVGVFRSTLHPGLPVCIVADDRPGAFSLISAAVTLTELDITRAEAYSRRLPGGVLEAVDLFWVRRPGVLRWASPADVATLHSALVVLLEGTFEREALLDHLRAAERAPSFGGTEIRCVPGAKQRIDALEVFAPDRPGLLFALSSALYAQRLHIVGSEVRTVGGRAIDRFAIAEHDGSPVPASRKGEIEEEIRRTLRPPRGDGGRAAPVPASWKS